MSFSLNEGFFPVAWPGSDWGGLRPEAISL